MSQLTHINASGEANMVDVSNKADTVREARAEAYVRMAPETLQLILSGQHHKGMCLPRRVLRAFKPRNVRGGLFRSVTRCCFPRWKYSLKPCQNKAAYALSRCVNSVVIPEWKWKR